MPPCLQMFFSSCQCFICIARLFRQPEYKQKLNQSPEVHFYVDDIFSETVTEEQYIDLAEKSQ